MRSLTVLENTIVSGGDLAKNLKLGGGVIGALIGGTCGALFTSPGLFLGNYLVAAVAGVSALTGGALGYGSAAAGIASAEYYKAANKTIADESIKSTQP